MMPYSDRRYLSAKKTVDDRALNKDVVERLRSELASSRSTSLRVLEVGAGLGTMVARLVDWNILRNAEYVFLDVDGDLLAASRDWLATWAAPRGHVVEARSDGLRIHGATADITITCIRAEVGEYLQREAGILPVDLLIANAFFDLVDVKQLLPQLFRLVAPAGLYWFSINYDGETIFQPEHPDDEMLMQVYHRSIDERVRYGRPAGDRNTGRHLFHHLLGAGATVLAAGASDWVVHGSDARYEADEEYFLHHIIHFIDQELQRQGKVDQHILARWVALRHEQARRGELIYVAHQLDFVGRRDPRDKGAS